MTRLFIQRQHIGQRLCRVERIITAVDDRNNRSIHKTMGRFRFFETSHNAVHVTPYVFNFTGKIANSKITVFPELIIRLATQFFHPDIER